MGEYGIFRQHKRRDDNTETTTNARFDAIRRNDLLICRKFSMENRDTAIRLRSLLSERRILRQSMPFL